MHKTLAFNESIINQQFGALQKMKKTKNYINN